MDHVEQVAVEVAVETLARVEGSALDWEPAVRFKEFGDSNINFVVVLRVKDRGAQYLLAHEFIKALFRRFREEGIEINYPVRNLYVRGQGQTPLAALPSLAGAPERVAPTPADRGLTGAEKDDSN